MDSWTPTLTTAQMAEFVANGVLRFDALVPAELNHRVLAQLPELRDAKYAAFGLGTAPPTPSTSRANEPSQRPTPGPQRQSGTAQPATGTAMSRCHQGTAIGEVLELPEVRGLVASLVGPDPRFDHDFVHHLPAGHANRQHLHPDAIVDTPDAAFDIQLFYFPHDVAPGAGGTRFVPGTHLRRAPSASTARFQHIVGEQRFAGPAGTILVFHHGLWHAGDDNPSPTDRWMYKIRLNPVVPQVQLWDLADFEAMHNDPTDHVFATSRSDSVAAILRRRQPWQGEAAFRYDLVERVKLWRYVSDDPSFDADHYLTRLGRPVAAAAIES